MLKSKKINLIVGSYEDNGPIDTSMRAYSTFVSGSGRLLRFLEFQVSQATSRGSVYLTGLVLI